jgi:pyrimidine deaminase RibD-like protein
MFSDTSASSVYSASSTSSYSIRSVDTEMELSCEISRRHRRCIDVAIEESYKSNILHKHGCVIASNGRILSRGYNTNRTSSKDGLISRCCSCHAEISAIRNLAKSEGLRGNYKQWVQHGRCKETYAKSNHLYRASIK